MAMKLSTIKDKVSTATIAWDGETVEVGYRPGTFTMQIAEDVAEAAALNDLSVISTVLEPILDWWDVLDDEGARLPTDVATIRAMPIGFLMAVMDGVQATMRPPESKG